MNEDSSGQLNEHLSSAHYLLGWRRAWYLLQRRKDSLCEGIISAQLDAFASGGIWGVLWDHQGNLRVQKLLGRDEP